MIRVGITGGIGSGKSTVCRLFEMLNVPVYYADERAKKLMTGNPNLKSEIISAFGVDSYFKNGKLNRKHLAELVFGNKSKLNALNSLVHPAVAADSEAWFQQQNATYAIKEAALLIESGGYKKLDALIFVSCPENIRIKRVMERDGVTGEQVTQRIKSQMPDIEKEKYADFIIYNDGRKSLISQVLKIHQRIKGSN